MKTSHWLVPVLFSCASTISTVAQATDIPVSTSAELMKATATAKPGDVIILADGTYPIKSGGQGVKCNASGTASAPITVKAANPLGARIECDAVECLYVGGAYWHFEGLEIHGVCKDDSTCEHAFHVVGKATDFVLRGSRIVDFNAQLKVNADSAHHVPDRGLVEGNEVFDTRARATGNPVTKLNIDNASEWVVRSNFIHDFEKGNGNHISFGAFHKGGSHKPVFEKNLVICSRDWSGGGARIGLSLGGGGMGAGMCPPWDGSDCNPETFDGVIRNNIIVGCSDVAIYLNEAQNTSILHNTMIATNGVDFRFSTSTGQAHGNVLSSIIRKRNGGTFTGDDNLMNVTPQQFKAWYVDPMKGDLSIKTSPTQLIDKGGKTQGVVQDYCGRTRSDDHFDWGALEHSLGDCATVPPPTSGGGDLDGGVSDSSTGGTGGSTGQDASSGGTGGSAGSGWSGTGGGCGSAGGGAGPIGPDASAGKDSGGADSAPVEAGDESDAGCGCRTALGTPSKSFSTLMGLLLAGLLMRRRRRYESAEQ